MTIARRIRVIILLAAGVLPAGAPRAATVTATFNGALTVMRDMNATLSAHGIVDGTPYRTVLTYDDSTPPIGVGLSASYFTGSMTTTFYPAAASPYTMIGQNPINIGVSNAPGFVSFLDNSVVTGSNIIMYVFTGTPGSVGPAILDSLALPNAAELTSLTEAGWFMRYFDGKALPSGGYETDTLGSLTSFSVVQGASQQDLPEPSSLALALVGLTGLAGLRGQALRRWFAAISDGRAARPPDA